METQGNLFVDAPFTEEVKASQTPPFLEIKEPKFVEESYVEEHVPDIRKEKEKLGDNHYESGVEALYCKEKAECIKEQDNLFSMAGLKTNKDRINEVVKGYIRQIIHIESEQINLAKSLDETKKTLTALLVEMGYDDIKINKNGVCAMKPSASFWNREKVWKA